MVSLNINAAKSTKKFNLIDFVDISWLGILQYDLN